MTNKDEMLEEASGPERVATLAKTAPEIYKNLGIEERIVLDKVARRILQGQSEYGHYDHKRDMRSFLHEFEEEIVDALVYIQNHRIKEAME